MRALQDLWRDNNGATSIEYALIVGLIALGITTTVHTVGDRIGHVMASVEAAIGAPPGNSPNAP